MPLFLTSLLEPSADHRIEALEDGFLIFPISGREVQFDALARRVIEHVGPFAVFPRKGAGGLYDCVHILPAVVDVTCAETDCQAAPASPPRAHLHPSLSPPGMMTCKEETAVKMTAAECWAKAADALAQARKATSHEVRDLYTRSAQEWAVLSINALAQETLERDLL